MSKASLEENIKGSFRINVDGFSGNNFENIFIGAKDSIFIFHWLKMT